MVVAEAVVVEVGVGLDSYPPFLVAPTYPHPMPLVEAVEAVVAVAVGTRMPSTTPALVLPALLPPLSLQVASLVAVGVVAVAVVVVAAVAAEVGTVTPSSCPVC